VQPGVVLGGRYRLVDRLGAGGMSVVWRGYDELLARPVAVKVLATALAGESSLRARIRREARAAGQLTHPRIAGVYDYGETFTPQGTIGYVVMELVDGPSLATVLGGGRLPWPTAVTLAAQVADALVEAHRRGLVHRDITPSNVLVTAAGVKIIDFGITAMVGETESSGIIGTPSYLAPERHAGGPAVAASDVYGLGMILHEMLAGARPPAPLPEGVPDEVAALCTRCLEPVPEQRSTAAEVAGTLGAVARSAAAPFPGVTGLGGQPGVVPAGSPRTLIGPGPTRIQLSSVDGFAPVDRWPPRRRQLVIACLLALAVGAGVTALIEGVYRGGQRPPVALPAPTGDPTRCAVAYQVSSQWQNGFTATVTIRNTGGADIVGWTLRFAFPDGQHVDQLWNGRPTQAGDVVSVADAQYNERIPQAGTVQFGFNASYHGANGAPRAFELNAAACRSTGDHP
jgi:serine/threonine-protein kinase